MAVAVVPPAARRHVRRSVIPGRGLSLGITWAWLSLVVLIPLLAVFVHSSELGWAGIWRIWSEPRVLAALRLSFAAALLAAAFNALMGTWVAWVLVRYPFPGRRLCDAMIDLPFALPTAVAGIALTALYGGNGWLGRWLEHPQQALRVGLKLLSLTAVPLALALVAGAALWWLLRQQAPGSASLALLHRLLGGMLLIIAGMLLLLLLLLGYGGLMSWFASGLGLEQVKVAYTPLGVVVALVFVGLPFVVRVVQPVLAESVTELEEAAATLGAGRWQTAWRVILPGIWPAVLTGFALAFARGVGEYGSVIFIAGNLPGKTEIAPLLITIRLGEFDYPAATAIAAAMLLLSLLVLLLVNGLQSWLHRRGRGETS
jgi:sulfate transport system permease protein